MIAAVVRYEGPIHTEKVARRVREAFGLERTGRRILENHRPEPVIPKAREPALWAPA